MLTASDPRVVAFYDFIQGKPKNADGHYIGSTQNESGLLYVIDGKEPMIQVWLPMDLIEYANAAAGSSGDRAVGIRVKGYRGIDAAANEVVRIFSSPETLAEFINSSECDYAGYHASRLAKKAAKAPKAVDVFWNKYGKEELAEIRARCEDRQQLAEDFQTMSMEDFEDKYMAVA